MGYPVIITPTHSAFHMFRCILLPFAFLSLKTTLPPSFTLNPFIHRRFFISSPLRLTCTHHPSFLSPHLSSFSHLQLLPITPFPCLISPNLHLSFTSYPSSSTAFLSCRKIHPKTCEVYLWIIPDCWNQEQICPKTRDRIRCLVLLYW